MSKKNAKTLVAKDYRWVARYCSWAARRKVLLLQLAGNTSKPGGRS